MNKKKIVILSGAGLDRESGIKTFRDSDGTWENHPISAVATPLGWKQDPKLVLDFYNQRRKQLSEVIPNSAHTDLVKLEEKFDVYHVTQNVSDLLERAGATNIIHLHGELTKARGVLYTHKSSPADAVYDIGYKDINLGDKCQVNQTQLRPHIVWFGERAPEIENAESVTMYADIFVIIGTSMKVNPAAGLVRMTRTGTPIYVIDPNEIEMSQLKARKDKITFIKKSATEGVRELVTQLMDIY